MSASLKINLTNLENLKKQLKLKPEVKIGIFSEHDARPDGKSNVSIGIDHEFGNPQEKLPMRSFLKMPLITKSDELAKAAKTGFKQALNEGNIEPAFVAIGKEGEKIIGEAFSSGGFGNWQELSQVTIDKKGNSTILVDEGYLKDSISSRVVYEK